MLEKCSEFAFYAVCVWILIGTAEGAESCDYFCLRESQVVVTETCDYFCRQNGGTTPVETAISEPCDYYCQQGIATTAPDIPETCDYFCRKNGEDDDG